MTKTCVVVAVVLGALLSGCTTRLGKVRADATPTETAADDPCIVQSDKVASSERRKPEFLMFDAPTLRFSNLYDAPYVWPEPEKVIALEDQGLGGAAGDANGANDVERPAWCP